MPSTPKPVICCGTPVAAVPTMTPEEGIDELDHAIGELGMKGIMISGKVHDHGTTVNRIQT